MSYNKYIFLFLLTFTCTVNTWGQTVAASTKNLGVEQFPTIMTIILVAVSFIVFVVGISALVKVNSLLTKRLMQMEAEKNGLILPSDEVVGVYPVEEDSFTKLRKKYWENPVPIDQEGIITLGHDYDGIRELDNHLPPWWVNMFILTVIWSIGYMYYYHWGGSGANQDQEYKLEVETAKKEIALALAGKANDMDESSVVPLTDIGLIGQGELIYKSVCAACHGQKGEGGVGPNFSDKNWIHGGGIKNIFKVIKYGVPEKGMIAWSAQLKPSDIQKVGSYILTLEGTNPPNPKAPQGEIWEEEKMAQDSLSNSDTIKAKLK